MSVPALILVSLPSAVGSVMLFPGLARFVNDNTPLISCKSVSSSLGSFT